MLSPRSHILESRTHSSGSLARINLSLAQRCYKARVDEIKAQLVANEEAFTTLVREVEEIQAGKWDDRIAAEIQQHSEEKGKKAKQTAPPPPAQLRRSTRTSSRTSEPPTPVVEKAPQRAVSLPAAVEPARREDKAVVEAPAAMTEATSPVVEKPNASDQLLDVSMDTEQPTEEGAAVSDTSISVPQGMAALPGNPKYSLLSFEGGETTAMSVDDAENKVSVMELEEPSKAAEESFSEEPVAEAASSPPGVATDAEEPTAVEKPNTRPRTRQQTVTRSKGKAPEAAQTETPEDKKRSRDASEVANEPESTSKRPRTMVPQVLSAPMTAAATKKFQTTIGHLHNSISQHRVAVLFHNPIKDGDAPDYSDIVKRPMDLKTMKGRIKDGRIKDSQEYLRDLYLMYANARMYNGPNSDVYKMTGVMMSETEHHIRDYLQTEGFRPT
ncbi:hypothetical protein FRB99_005538 [Tulasnella sp. 403]|nr:hypothetical protein FRB99_005538 [Tulasnella sp. 403]